MKKFIIVILIIFAFSTLCFSDYLPNTDKNPVFADSGFDSSYGGGGSYSGGSSFGGSSGSRSSYSSGSSGPLNPIAAGIMLSISAIYLTLYFTLTIRKNKKQTKKLINKTLKENFDLKPNDGCNDAIIQTAYENYVKIQIAWMNRDLTPVRHLLTDEIYNMYQMQVETLIEDNQINVMSNFKLICGKVESTHQHNNTETIKIHLCVQCKDYIKKADSSKVLNGSKRATLTYIYELTFLRNTTQDAVSNCPTCGAPVENQMSTNCPYCNNSLILTSSNITMSNKTIIHQFKY